LDYWKGMLDYTAGLLLTKTDDFCKLDSAIGDGDHGVAISKISNFIREKCALDYGSAEEMFHDIGWGIAGVQGGSSGPLWGMFISGMGDASEGASVAEVFEAGLDELKTICAARVGDKTMMDAFIPGAEAMKAAGSDADALEQGAGAAARGAEGTVDYIAKFGRAKNYGERSLGVKDAGACSIAVFFEGMYRGYQRMEGRTL
jgi:dihydroxyacetone kinase-like protein